MHPTPETIDLPDVPADIDTPARRMARTVDERLAELRDAHADHQRRLGWAADEVRRHAGQQQDRTYGRSRGAWNGTLEDAVAALRAKSVDNPYALKPLEDYDRQVAILAQISLETSEAEAVYDEERWNRLFLVTNDGGHVHNGLTCSTCFPTTQYEWLAYYSGASEDEIVAAAGETACTICYPTAPSEYLNRPAELVSRTRMAKQAAADAAAEAKALRELRRIQKAVTPDGSPLRVPASRYYETEYDRGEELTNEVTATRLWVDIELAKDDETRHMRPGQRQLQTQEMIAEALAAKHNRPRDEQMRILRAKADAKARRR